MVSIDFNKKVHYVLRIAVVMCFIGHGVFGIITKPVWCNYFAVFGIDQHMSYLLMPVVGGFDILLGLVFLLYPARIIPLWLLGWGLLTASLRPLSGEPFAELIERAGNFGTPLAFLLLAGFPKTIKEWFAPVQAAAETNAKTMMQVILCLRIVVFLLLAGHGWLNLLEKKGLIGQYTALGFSNPVQAAHIIGLAEIAFAFTILIRPLRPVLFALFIWKMISEMFYPSYGLFEWVERGGSYGAILALWMLAETYSVLKLNYYKRITAMH